MDYTAVTLDGKRRLRTIPLREELIMLTGHFVKAIALGQMIYWTERMYDFDEFIEEEQIRAGKKDDSGCKKSHGWIYKSGAALAEETLLGYTPTYMRRVLKELVDEGLLEERANPDNHRDRTMQYRPDYVEIQKRLRDMGCPPPAYMRPVVSAVEEEPENNEPNNLPEVPEETITPTVQAATPPKKRAQTRKHSTPAFYGPDHYEKITAEEWEAAVKDGEMPGRESKISLVLGYYILKMKDFRDVNIVLKGSDISGRYGKNVKEMLEYFEVLEGEDNALLEALNYVDWWVESDDPWVANETKWSLAAMLSISQYRDKYGVRNAPTVADKKDWTKGSLGNSRSTKIYSSETFHQSRSELF